MKTHEYHKTTGAEVFLPAYDTAEYESLVGEVDAKLVPNHTIVYVPFTPDQKLDAPQHLHYADQSELPDLMAGVDIVIAISRDEELNPDYTDARPDHNIILPPSARSNVDKSAELFHMALDAGNENIKFIATGRMHNRAIRMMRALPIIAEAIGLNAEDVYHTPEHRFEQLLRATFTPENIHKLALETDDDDLVINYKDLRSLFGDLPVPTEQSSQAELDAAADAILAAYRSYPRLSTSELMVEQAQEGGVSPDVIFEEDGAVDTISNLLNTVAMLKHDKGLDGVNVRRVAIVAGSDHLPRTTWIADHLLPDGIEIVCVESNPNLDADTFAASCAREEASFKKGSNWIGDTRDIQVLEQRVEAGYFGINSKTTEEIARDVAAQALKGIGSTK